MERNQFELAGETFAIEDKINVELRSPFFDLDEVALTPVDSITPRNQNSWPVELKNDERLRTALGNADLLESRSFERKAEAAIRSDGVKFMEGTAYFRKGKRNLNSGDFNYEMLLKMRAPEFAENIKGKTLHDLEMGGPIEVGALANIYTWLNAWEAGIGDSLKMYFNVDTGVDPPEISLKIQQGYDVFRWPYDNIAYDDLAPISAFATDIIANGHDYICFPSMYMEEGLQGRPTTGILNYCKSSAVHPFDVTLYASGSNDVVIYQGNKTHVVPCFYYHRVLRHIFSEHGYTLEGGLLEDAHFLKLAIKNTHCIDKPESVIIHNAFGFGGDNKILWCEGYCESIIPKDHLPAMSIELFLQNFQKMFNCYFEPAGNGTIRIVMNDFEKTQMELASIGEVIEIETQPTKGVKISYNLSSGKEYEEARLFADRLSTITESVDDSIGATIGDGNRWLQNDHNQLFVRDSGNNVLECDNVVPFITDPQGKDYKLELPPVAMIECPYEWTAGSIDTAYIPRVGHEITYTPESEFILWWESLFGGTTDLHYNIEPPVAGGTPVRWENEAERSGEEAYALGFYYGKLTTHTANNIPLMLNGNYRLHTSGTASTKVGDWHLGLLGEEGIVKTHWRQYISMLNMARKIRFRPNISLMQIKGHQWNKNYLVRGQRIYISGIFLDLPLEQLPIYEGWQF